MLPRENIPFSAILSRSERRPTPKAPPKVGFRSAKARAEHPFAERKATDADGGAERPHEPVNAGQMVGD